VSTDSKQSVTSSSTELVVRSDVPPGLDYPQYREYLRPDFFFSCAYCTIGESEAAAIRFAIDHYEPRRYRPELTNSYDNLMYACNQCNVLKGDRMPSAELRARGFRFFRPDTDAFSDHFEKTGLRVLKKTDVGYYTIEALDLNRQALSREVERVRCPRADLQSAPGRLGYHVSRHYDRGGRCIPGLGQAKAGNARADRVPGSLA
jgi:hypothetical protein